MTKRMLALPLAALTSLAILVAACGPGAATQAPGATQGAAATQGPVATQRPAATGGGEPSLDLSSFHGDVKLEDMFPKEIGGTALVVLSMTGDQFMGQGDSPELDAALAALGKSSSDLSVAFGGAGGITIVAFRIQGVSGSSLLTALFTAYAQDEGTTVTDVTIAGKAAKKIVAPDETTYVYAAQDAVFGVGGEAITDAQLTEAFTKLP